MGTNAKLSSFQVAQDFFPEHWDWSRNEMKAIRAKDVAEMGKIIKSRLEAGGCEIDTMYAIEHNADAKEMWNLYEQSYNLQFSRKHGHWIGLFKKGRGATLPQIAKLIGIDKNFIEKPKKSKFSFENSAAYLIHIKYPKKYRYEPSMVVTLAGQDYMDFYDDNCEKWLKYRAKQIANTEQEDIAILAMKINEENWTPFEILADEHFKNVYKLNKSYFDKILKANFEIQKMEKQIEDAKNGHLFNMLKDNWGNLL